MREYRKYAVVVGLAWLAFWGVGVGLHRACEGREVNALGWVSIDAYDSEAFLRQFTRIDYVFDVNHRHPVMKPLLLPVFAVGTSLAEKVGPEAGKVGVLGCFALIAAVNLLLLWRIIASAGATPFRQLATLALWLSFAHVWLLGGMAESFGISTLLLLMAVRMRQRNVRDARAWLALTIVTSGVTVTNGIKPFIAWAPERRHVVRFALGAAAAVLVAVVALVCKWLLIDGYTIPQALGYLGHDVGSGFVPMTFGERLWFAWNSFVCQPIVLHGPVVTGDILHDAYTWIGPHLLVAAVIVLAAVGAWSRRGEAIVRIVLVWFAFDVLLHVVVGWGLNESQIYCGHWFWMLPIFVSFLPERRFVSPAVLVLAALIAGENLRIALAA